jgi:glycosyltransferase involved in cell wall biosynthesis
MLLVAPRCPSGLTQAVSRLTTEPQLRSRLEAGAKTLAEAFTWDEIARRTTAFFASLIPEGR